MEDISVWHWTACENAANPNLSIATALPPVKEILRGVQGIRAHVRARFPDCLRDVVAVASEVASLYNLNIR